MVADSPRAAGRLAALIAVPIALLAGVGTFLLLGDAFGGERSAPVTAATSTAPPAPVATGPVTMPARELTEWQEIVCRAVLSQLPEQLDGQPHRPVSEGPEQNAAYGEPPILLTCGVPEARFAPTDPVYPLAGVCWHAREESTGSIWTTLDREVPVQVSVPAAYDGPAQQVMELSPVIIQTVRSAETAPSGCG